MNQWDATGNALRCLIILAALAPHKLLCINAQPVAADGFVNTGINDNLYPQDALRNLGSLYPLAGKIPTSRVYHTVSCCLGEDVVVYGGYGSNGDILNDINIYDSRFQRLSGPLLQPECCNEAGQVIETLGTASQADIPSYYGKKGFQGDLPLGRAEHGAAIVNSNTFYIHGGQTSLYALVGDLYSFTIDTLRWTRINAIGSQKPGARAGHCMSVVGGTRLIIFGGRGPVPGSAVGRSSNPQYTVSTIYTSLYGLEKNYTSFTAPTIKALNDVWEFDTLSKCWTQLSTAHRGTLTGYGANNIATMPNVAPAGREHAAMTIVNERMYIFGGQDPVSGVIYSDLWVFDISAGTWQELIANSEPSGISIVYVPPLHSAHLILATPDLQPSLSSSFRPTSDSSNNTLNTPKLLNLMLYGGVGNGGSCAVASMCPPLLSTLGQVYSLQLSVGTLNVPRSTLDSRNKLRLQTEMVLNATWTYARLTSSTASRGRLTKNYAFERVAYVATKNQLFEFGGIRSTVPLNAPLDAAGTPEVS
jgi:hypothetical protein